MIIFSGSFFYFYFILSLPNKLVILLLFGADNFKTVNNFTQYSESVDKQGNVNNRAFVHNKSNEQLMFIFNEGLPIKCIITLENGTSHDIDLVENTSVVRKSYKKGKKYKLTEGNVMKLKALANGDLSQYKEPNICSKMKDYFDLLF